MSKLGILRKSILGSMTFWFGLLILCTAEKDKIPAAHILTFFAPYYLLWLCLNIISIIKRSKPMTIIWSGSLRSDELQCPENAPYALLFLGASLLILLLQSAGFLRFSALFLGLSKQAL